MVRRLFIFGIAASLLVSCSKDAAPIAGKTAPIQTPETAQGPSSTGSGMVAESLNAIKKQQQEEKEKYDGILWMKLEDCDSDRTKKIQQELLKTQNIPPDRFEWIAATATERCKVRAIIRDNLNCSALMESGSVERCEYAKRAVKEVWEFQEKKAAHDRLFGSADYPGNQRVPEILSSWW